MSAASLAAYDRILPDLPRRERQVLNILVARLRDKPGGPSGLTCRELANRLGLDRDSVSPRIGKLQNLGLVVPAGIFGKETIFEAYSDPTNAKPRPVRKARPYRKALADIEHGIATLRTRCSGRMEYLVALDDVKAIIRDLANP